MKNDSSTISPFVGGDASAVSCHQFGIASGLSPSEAKIPAASPAIISQPPANESRPSTGTPGTPVPLPKNPPIPKNLNKTVFFNEKSIANWPQKKRKAYQFPAAAPSVGKLSKN